MASVWRNILTVSAAAPAVRKGEPTTVVRLPVPVAAYARRLARRGELSGDVAAVMGVEARSVLAVPMAAARAACGFPSPADDYLENPLDFNELLVSNAAATFAVRLASDSMTGAGLFPGDIAVVDRSVEPVNGCIVVALLDGEFTVKRYWRKGGVVTLRPENPAFAAIAVTEEQALEIWGVVTRSIRML